MTHPSDIAGLSDPDHIWLQNADDAKHQGEGRMWCEDKVWPDDPEDGEPTKYVRADLFDLLSARAKELEAEGDAIADRCQQVYSQGLHEANQRVRRAEQQRDEAVTALDRLASFSISDVHAKNGKLSDVCKAWVDHKKDALAVIRRLASGPEGGSEGEK